MSFEADEQSRQEHRTSIQKRCEEEKADDDQILERQARRRNASYLNSVLASTDPADNITYLHYPIEIGAQVERHCDLDIAVII